MQSKGTNLLNIAAFVRETFDDAAWQRVVATLDEPSQRALAEVVAVGWYDYALELSALRAVETVLGRGDGSLADALGHFQAEEDLTKIHRLFLRLASPAFVLEKSGEYWRRFYTGGRWVVTREGQRAATGRLFDVEPPEALFCQYLVGYIQRMFELVGAGSPIVTHAECRAQGDARCMFRGSWS